MKVSSITGAGIVELIDLLISTATKLPYSVVPEAWLDLSTEIQDWGTACLESGKAPVCTRAEIEALPGFASEVLDFLSVRGLVFLTQGDIVVVYPPWLADAFTHALAPDAAVQKMFPEAFCRGGVLWADKEILAAIWPDSKGFTDVLRQCLWDELHVHGFAFQIVGRPETESTNLRRPSIVPWMLPHNDDKGSLDRMLGSLVCDEAEVGVQYTVNVSKDIIWPMLVQSCADMLTPTSCFSNSAVLEYNGQRALLCMVRNSVSLVCRGTAPTELRGRFHSILTDLVRRKFTFLNTDQWVHVLCHVCHQPSCLWGRIVKRPVFYCMHGHDEDVVLEVKDLLTT